MSCVEAIIESQDTLKSTLLFFNKLFTHFYLHLFGSDFFLNKRGIKIKVCLKVEEEVVRCDSEIMVMMEVDGAKSGL